MAAKKSSKKSTTKARKKSAKPSGEASPLAELVAGSARVVKKLAATVEGKSAVTQMLETQHREVEAIFKKLENGKGQTPELLKQLANNLAAHMAIEQNIYYPAVKKLKSDLISESYEEHSLAELGLKRLLSTRSTNEAFEARVTACKELIKHHVEEEEKELFPVVDRRMKAEELDALAEEMQAEFDAALAKGFKKLVPAGMDTTSADATRA